MLQITVYGFLLIIVSLDYKKFDRHEKLLPFFSHDLENKWISKYITNLG